VALRGNSSATRQTNSLHDHGKAPQQRHRNTKDSFQLTGLLFESRNHGRKMANRQVEALCAEHPLTVFQLNGQAFEQR
jgi:hypothetical protein